MLQGIERETVSSKFPFFSLMKIKVSYLSPTMMKLDTTFFQIKTKGPIPASILCKARSSNFHNTAACKKRWCEGFALTQSESDMKMSEQ